MLLVWPKFLDSKFHPIEQYLRLILKSETEEQFISACDKVYQILSKYDNGLAATFVNDIKTRYKYYGGFYLHVVTGLMNMIGSHEVEQNHAWTHAYLGNGDHLPIVTQMKELIMRQQNRIRQYNEAECKWEQLGLTYKSTNCVGRLRIGDIAARKSLNQFAFSKLWTPQLIAGQSLLMEEEEDSYVFLA